MGHGVAVSGSSCTRGAPTCGEYALHPGVYHPLPRIIWRSRPTSTSVTVLACFMQRPFACRVMATWSPTLWTWLAASMPWTAQWCPRCLLLLLPRAGPACIPSHPHTLPTPAPVLVCCRAQSVLPVLRRRAPGIWQPAAICTQGLQATSSCHHQAWGGLPCQGGDCWERPDLAPWEWQTPLLQPLPLALLQCSL